MNKRRKFIYQSAGLISTPFVTQILGCSTPKIISKPIDKKSIGSVVIVGGGFAGATAAKYLHQWGNGLIKVVIIEKNDFFYSCPMSNLVLSGSKNIGYIKHSYDSLKRKGILVIKDEAILETNPETFSILAFLVF